MGVNTSHETYESINEDFKDGKKYYAKFDSDYFAEGVCRYAFKGILYGNGPRNGSKCVTKVFKDAAASKLKDWAPDIAASKRAFGYAQHFQEQYFPRIRNFSHSNEIEFLIPLIANMKDISGYYFLWFIKTSEDTRYTNKRSVVAIEPYIEGSYEKFNSNGGYEKDIHYLMTTFTHWTWEISGHRYMVCDLQGVKSGRKYILTDPAIHSVEHLFGPTDLGEYGMERVLGNHTCNRLCTELGLSNPFAGTYVATGSEHTTRTFQVTEQEMMRAERNRAAFFPLLQPVFE